MVIGRQEVASAEQKGHFDLNRSLPLARTALVASDATVTLITALPGIAAAPAGGAGQTHPIASSRPSTLSVKLRSLMVTVPYIRSAP
ncbi:hypothetical protein [Streptomyces sulphureus]|uniref:hypothetical protein n=1 Tax=Streptomyces sulphureus TaxID=47758 RepID=UPI00037E02A2|nr:hypothetical protein [Streptomyces sulphureus]